MINTFAYAAVDAIQDSKKQFVKTCFKHEGVSDALNAFIDAQTAYTKSAVDAGVSVMTALMYIAGNEATKSFLYKKGK